MKPQPCQRNKAWCFGARRQHRDSGMATLVFITLLAIMMILVMAELRCIVHLRREIKFMEQQQIKRLNRQPAPAPPAGSAPAGEKPASS